MKLIIAIINNDDSAAVSAHLSREYYTVTRLSTTGGFLMTGNTTLLIGSDDEDIDRAKEIIRTHAKSRKKRVMTTESFGRGMSDSSIAEEDVNVSGATVFVLNVDSMEKY